MRIFEELESNVRSYIRSFPTIFSKAKMSTLYDEQGNEFIDFFAGAGTLNYGHNNPLVNKALIEYIENDGIVHGLDKATTAKKEFLQKMKDVILQPRNMNYRIQFPGPTGTNAVETALKLVRMVKQRSNVISFTNGYHGLTMGSMAVTGNSFYRDEAFINRVNVSFMPYEGFFDGKLDSIEFLRKTLSDGSSGVDLPAAVIVETIQAEGGINVATAEWLRGLERVCREFDILLIIDDIQVGNGRTGQFFSFEEAGINPDIIVLSKSIGGGLPLSLVLLKPELDQWKPGEHTGTFRGNNLAFVAAREILSYWETNDFAHAINEKSKTLRTGLEEIAGKYKDLGLSVRGRGMIFGLEVPPNGTAAQIAEQAFGNGLIIERAGFKGDVIKILPPLVIEDELIHKGLEIIDQSIAQVLEKRNTFIEEGVIQ